MYRIANGWVQGFVGLLIAVFVCTAVSAAEPTADVAAQTAREEAFAKLMSGATLEGQFTAHDKQEGKLPAPEKYTLGKVSKIKDDLWQFQARIQYGKRDIEIPLAIRVVWAGDTPIITLDNLDIPTLGKFTARVMIFHQQYSGMWDGGGKHGGLMFGKVVPATTADVKPVEPSKP